MFNSWKSNTSSDKSSTVNLCILASWWLHVWFHFIDNLSVREVIIRHPMEPATAHLKTDVLALLVAVQPQDQVVHPSTLQNTMANQGPQAMMVNWWGGSASGIL